MSKSIYLHAGAHRAGSSSFQLCLAQNRDLLMQAGFDVAYPARDGAPDGMIQLRFPDQRDPPEKTAIFGERARRRMLDVSPDAARPLIFSEENVPGRLYPILKGKFFPAARKRADVLVTGFGGAPVHVVYVLRPYAEYFLSLYRLRAQSNAIKPFEDFVPGLMRLRRGWPELVQDLQASFAPAAFTVVAYAQRGESRDLLRVLVPGLEDLALSEPERTVNLSATDAALQALQAIYREGVELETAEARAVVEAHRDDRRELGVAAFDPAQTAVLEARYAQDLERIGQMPGVRLIA